MPGCQGACATPNAAGPAAFPQQPQVCAQTSTTGAAPCVAPSYSRACMPGDPAASPLRIERMARLEHSWDRTMLVPVPAAGLYSVIDVLFPSFTSAGSVCLKSVTLTVQPIAGVATPVQVIKTGVSGVWDFIDSNSPDWTMRVAYPCEVEVQDIVTTSGRCPCQVDCEGCIYPAGVGGLFMVRYRFSPINLATTDIVRVSASGTHDAGPPCCTMPRLLDESLPAAGPYPAVQFIG